MTWQTHHRRAEVLREVIRTADTRLDGLLPMDVAGVTETFRDELTLLGALQLRWHTRLAGRIERELSEQPLDLESAVVAAWQATAGELPGIRAIVDHYVAAPTTDEMALTLRKATGKEHAMLALMAGRASIVDPGTPTTAPSGVAAQRIGEAIALRARTSYDVAEGTPSRTLIDRIRAVLAA